MQLNGTKKKALVFTINIFLYHSEHDVKKTVSVYKCALHLVIQTTHFPFSLHIFRRFVHSK